jgi:sortase A
VRRNIQILGWTLIWSGVFIFGFLGWQLFGTDVVNAGVQAKAAERVEIAFEEARQQPAEAEAIVVAPQADEPAQLVQFYSEEIPEEGSEVGVMRIPKIGLEVVVFEGVLTSTLKKGPGHTLGTALPGQPGNAVISGHRTTYGRPFFDLDLLEPGDIIEVETAIGVHIYEVRESFVVKPTDVWVTDNRDGAWLTLTTCTPKYSARERLIITAEMVDGPNAEYVAYQDSLRAG